MGEGRLSGKRALVTAAGQGIGRASALAMASEGATVFATDVNDAALADISLTLVITSDLLSDPPRFRDADPIS